MDLFDLLANRGVESFFISLMKGQFMIRPAKCLG